MSKYIELVIGGAAGTIARYLLGGLVYSLFGTAFPYGTMAVNMAGCFIIGFLSAMAESKFLLGGSVRLTLMIGFCGAFTTFSTLIFETDALIRDGELLRAAANLAVSIVLGIVLFRLGTIVAELL